VGAKVIFVKIVVIGRGHVGGGLARLWSSRGHQVSALGRDGGDASDAEVVVVAVAAAPLRLDRPAQHLVMRAASATRISSGSASHRLVEPSTSVKRSVTTPEEGTA
jgi:prephenate dehydrogenase